MKQAWLTFSLISLGVLGITTAALLRPATPDGHATASRPPDSHPRRVLYYRDPMHPSYTSNRPGKAPDCGMDLQPVYDESSPSTVDESEVPPGLLRVTHTQQTMIGMRVEPAEASRVNDTVRTLGRVVLDENRVFPVVAAADGWIVDIPPQATTGTAVKNGQPLARVYGRDYATAQRTFLYALRSVDNPPPRIDGDSQDQPALALQEARLVLQSLGFGDAAIAQLAATRQPKLEVTLTSPAAGVIISRSVFRKQRIERGAELFRIVDLGHIWIAAELFGNDAGNIARGASAQLSVAGQPNRSRSATISDAQPVFAGRSRTVRLRLEADNRDLALRPDMLVDLDFPISHPVATTVPADAVIESGPRKTVFVQRGDELFEPRAVEIGWRSSRRVQIVRGVSAGEPIVVAGTFLLDSESRMRRRDAAVHD